MPTFEFNQQLVPQNQIDLSDIGEFAIEASNDDGYFYYLVVRTSLGTTSMASCGPIVPDVGLLPSGYSTSLTKMPYKEEKIDKTISLWLNDKSKKLTSAQVIDADDALDQFRDLGAYFKNYSEELY